MACDWPGEHLLFARARTQTASSVVTYTQHGASIPPSPFTDPPLHHRLPPLFFLSCILLFVFPSFSRVRLHLTRGYAAEWTAPRCACCERKGGDSSVRLAFHHLPRLRSPCAHRHKQQEHRSTGSLSACACSLPSRPLHPPDPSRSDYYVFDTFPSVFSILPVP